MHTPRLEPQVTVNEDLNSKHDEKYVYSHVLFLLIRQQKLIGSSPNPTYRVKCRHPAPGDHPSGLACLRPVVSVAATAFTWNKLLPFPVVWMARQ